MTHLTVCIKIRHVRRMRMLCWIRFEVRHHASIRCNNTVFIRRWIVSALATIRPRTLQNRWPRRSGQKCIGSHFVIRLAARRWLELLSLPESPSGRPSAPFAAESERRNRRQFVGSVGGPLTSTRASSLFVFTRRRQGEDRDVH